MHLKPTKRVLLHHAVFAFYKLHFKEQVTLSLLFFIVFYSGKWMKCIAAIHYGRTNHVYGPDTERYAHLHRIQNFKRTRHARIGSLFSLFSTSADGENENEFPALIFFGMDHNWGISVFYRNESGYTKHDRFISEP